MAVHLKQPCSSVGRCSGTSGSEIRGSHQALQPAAWSCFSSAVKPNPPKAPSAIALAMETFQLSFPLPRSLEARIYVHLTIQAKSVMIFLTTAAADELGTPPPMGSFVYALPDVSRLVGSPLRRIDVTCSIADRTPIVRSSIRASRSPPRCTRPGRRRSSPRGWRGCSQRRPSCPSTLQAR